MYRRLYYWATPPLKKWEHSRTVFKLLCLESIGWCLESTRTRWHSTGVLLSYNDSKQKSLKTVLLCSLFFERWRSSVVEASVYCLTATLLSMVSNSGVRKIFLRLIIANFVATVVVSMLALLDFGWLLLQPRSTQQNAIVAPVGVPSTLLWI